MRPCRRRTRSTRRRSRRASIIGAAAGIGPAAAERGAALERRSTPARRRQARRRVLTALLFLSPWIVGFLVFTAYPMAASLYFSFTSFDILSTPSWVGLKNYEFMFGKDPFFWLAVRNTVWIIVFGVPLRILLAVATAWLLTRPRRGVKVYRTLFFLPTMAPAVAASLSFVYLFNPEIGPMNLLIRAFGVENPPLWFFSPGWAKPALLLLILWGMGDTMIVFLAGLLDVPRQLYEAADIEGATGWQKFRWVTVPMISPVVFFSLVTGIIGGFQFFTQAYVASGQVSGSASVAPGAPQGALLFYSVHLYEMGFQFFKMGYAAALAWILLVITLICTVVILRTSRRWVHYQGAAFR